MGFDQQIQDVEQQHVYTYNLIYIYWFSQQKTVLACSSQQTLGEPAIKGGFEQANETIYLG